MFGRSKKEKDELKRFIDGDEVQWLASLTDPWFQEDLVETIPPLQQHGETIETDAATGGRKARKLAQFSLIPSRPLWKIAEVFGMGASKYDPDNWRRSYKWSWSIDSLHRHINLFEQGQDLDPDSGLPHLAHAAVHCMFLLEWMETHPETDNRSKYEDQSSHG